MDLVTISSYFIEGILDLGRDVLASKELLPTSCVVRIEEDHTILPILNILSERVVLPQGFDCCPLSNRYFYRSGCSTEFYVGACTPVKPVPLRNSDINRMMAETPCVSERSLFSLIRLVPSDYVHEH